MANHPTSGLSQTIANTSDRIVPTDEFSHIIRLFEQGSNIFITGVAGTGKSTLLTMLRNMQKKNMIVLAPTGIAALNVEGSTIHAFFRFPTRLLKEHDPGIKLAKDKKKTIQLLSTIIIDEISMVRADILDGIDYILKLARENDQPFGGVQMIFFGDMLQLPPVVPGKELNDYFNNNYGGPYFFNAKSFSEKDFIVAQLTIIFRQKDKKFQDILNCVRLGRMNNETLGILNAKYSPDINIDEHDTTITLCATNNIATEINNYRLGLLKTPTFTYEAVITGKFEQASFPTDFVLTLKEGTQVMMVKNDGDKRWVNGSIGIITGLSQNSIRVDIDGATYTVEKAKWEVIEYTYNKETKQIESEEVGSFTQFPVKMAWAVTIHKSQGKTFDKVKINLGRGAFSHGQTYVALSRCRSLDGIQLLTRIRYQDIIVDQRVLTFMENAKFAGSSSS